MAQAAPASTAPSLPDAAAALLPSLEALPDVDSRDEAVRVLTSLRRLATNDEAAFLALCDHGGGGEDDDEGLSGGLDAVLTGTLACLENFPSDESAAALALGVVSDVAYLPSNRLRMAEYDELTEAVIDAALSAMDEAKESEAAQTEGCAALTNLLAPPRKGPKLSPDRSASAARAASQAISSHSGSVGAVEAGCAALRHVLLAAEDPAAAARVAREGGCAAAVAACLDSNPDGGLEVHSLAAGVACALLRSDLPSFRADGDAANAAASVACSSLLRHGSDLQVALHGIEALDRLLGSSSSSSSSSEARTAAAASTARSNGVTAVSGAMAAHPSDPRIQGMGCDVLAALGSHVRVREEADDGGAGAVEAIVAAVGRGGYADTRRGGRARESACRALRKLLAGGWPPSPSFCARVVDSGGVDALLGAVRDRPDDADLLREALEALLLLVRASDKCSVQLRGKGDVQTLLYEASRRHPQKVGKLATDVLKSI